MSEPKKLYSSEAITRAYKLVEVLAGHELDPLSNKEIQLQTGWNGPTTTRQCQAAVVAGMVESAGAGKWRLSVSKFSNIAVAVQHGAQRARSRMEDKINNYTRSAY